MTTVSSSLTTLPAFETEHVLFIAEEGLRRLQKQQRQPSCAHSVALQTVADAYLTRCAGDRVDNLARTAQLLARAAALPASRRCEAAARASAMARLSRALLARAAVPICDEGSTPCVALKNEPEAGQPNVSSTQPQSPPLSPVPPFMALQRNPNPRTASLARKALLTATAATDLLAASVARTASKDTDPVDMGPTTSKGLETRDARPKRNVASRNLRNLRAALHVDRARALIMGAHIGDVEGVEGVPTRIEATIAALRDAGELRDPASRREHAAGALADIVLASLYSRERGNSKADRARAVSLFRSAESALAALFGGSSDSDSAVSKSPSRSPTGADEYAHGSDCSEDSLSLGVDEVVEGSGCVAEDGHHCARAALQDAFSPFEAWDLNEVRSFVGKEMQRLGPVAAEGHTRDSCVLF